MNLTLLLINILAGGLVGYVTKSLAINMLFRKYPLIGGAEIIKDRENLEKAMSLLVEERLIRPTTLLEEFQKPAFQESFEHLLYHMMRQSIGKNIESWEQLEEIQGFNETTANLKTFLLTHQDHILPICTDVLFDHLLVEDVLSEAQFRHILNYGIQQLSNYHEVAFTDVYQELRQELQQVKLGQLLSSESYSALLQLCFPDQVNEHYQNSLDSLFGQAQTLYQDFWQDANWEALQQTWQNLTLGRLMGGTEASGPLATLVPFLQEVIQSPKGQHLLRQIINQIIILLKQLEVPLADLLTANLEQQLVSFIEKHLPSILEPLEEWLSTNKAEMESMIQSAVEEHLQSENLIKQVLGNIFGQQLTKRYQVLEKTLEELKTIAQQQGPGDIAALVSRLLHNTRVSVLISYLEKHILDESALSELLLALLDKYLPLITTLKLDWLFQRKIKDLPLFNQVHIKQIFDFLFMRLQDFIRNQAQSSQMAAQLRQWLQAFYPVVAQLPVGAFLPPDARIWQDSLQELLRSPWLHALINQTIAAEQWQFLQKKTINQILTPGLKDAINHNLGELYSTKIDDLLATLKQESIRKLYQSSSQIYSELAKNEVFASQITHTVVSLMIELIRDNHLLDGKIYIAIKESFTRFSDDELKTEMDSFMGTELQPIKLLGAVLGALVGIGMWRISLIPAYSNFVTGYWALLSYSFSYAITEVGTNWMAIKMLFRPYHPVKIPGLPWNLPFTPGIFPKNKKALADSMVNFIDKKLLSKDNMVKILEKYHHTWRKVIKSVVSRNDYKAVDETLQHYTRAQYTTVSPMILSLGFDEMHRNRQEVSRYLAKEIQHVAIADLNMNALQAEIQNQLESNREKWIAMGWQHLRNSPPPIPQAWSLQRYLSETWPTLQQLPLPSGLLLLQCITKGLQNTGSGNRVLKEFFANGSHSGSTNLLWQILSQQLNSPQVQEQIIQMLKEQLGKINLPTENTVGNLFDGKLIDSLLAESDFIMASVSQYLLKIAHHKKSEVARLILSDIQTQGVVEFMLVAFGGVKTDIRRVVDVLVEQKLPPYLAEKQIELKTIFQAYVSEQLANIPLDELGLNEDMFNFDNIWQLCQQYLFSHPELIRRIHELLDAVISNLLSHLQASDLSRLMNIHSPTTLVFRFAQEGRLLGKIFKEQGQQHPELKPQWQQWLVNLISPLNKAIGLSEVLRSSPDLIQLQPVLDLPSVQHSTQAALNWFFQNIESHFPAILDAKLVEADLAIGIEQLTRSSLAGGSRRQDFQVHIQNALQDLTFQFVDVLNTTVEKETKEVLEEILVNSLIDSMRVHNREILEPINFDAIVRQEVERMEPERIESLFDFAKPIFRLLIWYGAWGGVIGLAVGILEFFR